MKTIIYVSGIVIFFSLSIYNSFAQTTGKKAKNTANTDTTAKSNKSLTADTVSGKKSVSTIPTKPAQKVDTSNAMAQYKGKVYVFDKSLRLTECNYIGEVKNPTYPAALTGTKFNIVGTEKNYLIISFWIWGLPKHPHIDLSSLKSADSLAKKINSVDTKSDEKKLYTKLQIIAKRETFNFKQYSGKQFAPATLNPDSVNDNLRYFLLEKDSLKTCCSEYNVVKNWDINFGVLTTPFKLRMFGKFAFSNNMSIGTAVYYQKNLSTNWSWGVVGGLSLTSVTLDASSTNIYPDGTTSENVASMSRTPITTSSTRPAFTPSASGLITYKNISLTLGLGADYINKPTSIATKANPEAGWIYNGRPWIGIGFGVSLFSNNKPTPTTPTDDSQATKPK